MDGRYLVSIPNGKGKGGKAAVMVGKICIVSIPNGKGKEQHLPYILIIYTIYRFVKGKMKFLGRIF